MKLNSAENAMIQLGASQPMVDYAKQPQVLGVDMIRFRKRYNIRRRTTRALAGPLGRIEWKPGLLDYQRTLNAVVYSAKAEPFQDRFFP